MSKLRFSLVLHNHQPVGNFDEVIEAAYRDSYLPFLDVIEGFPDIPFCLHTSGCLMEWLERKRPEYIARMRRLAAAGCVEILGGGFYEPILTMIPSHDRIGQIRGYSEYLRDLLECNVRGMWLAERVWEQSLTPDIVDSGMEFTILDDHHFRIAGVPDDARNGNLTTEDQGRVLRVFSGSETARYMIPFRDVAAVFGWLGSIHHRVPDALVVFADDGEKFGSWPDTKAHVYERGWLARFLGALRENRHWIDVCTMSQAMDSMPATGRVYLPDCSYREMTEWALSTDEQSQYRRSSMEMDQQPWGPPAKRFLRGGSWRNFKVRYPETQEMYARMMEVSRKLHQRASSDPSAFGDHRLAAARRSLYRAQCNCPYWHGAFGGLYLPHLRGAAYRNLIDADNRLEEFELESGANDATADRGDWNLDGRDEVRLANRSFVAYISPTEGGQIYELDVRDVGVNLGANLSRRPEAYHERIRAHAENRRDEDPHSIHDLVRFKQQGLENRLDYDRAPRRILVDRFLSASTTIDDAVSGRWEELSDFHSAPFDIDSLAGTPSPSVTLVRQGSVDGQAAKVQKSIALHPDGDRLRISYELSNLPAKRPLLFAVESNIASLASGADDRYVLDSGRRRMGRIGDVLGAAAQTSIALVDEWIGIEVGLSPSRPADAWMFPIQTVSQSEGGFELVHQGYCVVLAWLLQADATRWAVTLDLGADCRRRLSRYSATSAAQVA